MYGRDARVGFCTIDKGLSYREKRGIFLLLFETKPLSLFPFFVLKGKLIDSKDSGSHLGGRS